VQLYHGVPLKIKYLSRNFNVEWKIACVCLYITDIVQTSELVFVAFPILEMSGLVGRSASQATMLASLYR
jgi:hypothetical protein